jgi:cytochrome b
MTTKRIRVWDLPTRVFHVLLILGVTGAFLTVYASDELMVWHGRIGLFLLGLVLWRLIWGVVGGHWSRFVHFVEHPKAAWQTLKHHSMGRSEPSVGHNPLGAWSVMAILLVFLLQALTGMCSDDEAGFTGPLSQYLSSESVEWLTWYHSELGQPLIWTLLGLHVGVIFYHRWRLGDDLITPMITGDKEWAVDEPVTESGDTGRQRVAALLLWCALNGTLFYVFAI